MDAHASRVAKGEGMSRVRIVRNRHGSALAACEAWLAGTLWGRKIVLSADNIHVYGCWSRKWKPVNVQFLRDKIVVVRP